MIDPRVVLDVIAELEVQRDAVDEMIKRLRSTIDGADVRPVSGRWSDAEDAMILDTDLTHAQLAAMLGRTTTAVSARISRLRRGLT